MEEGQEFTVFPADTILLVKIEKIKATEKQGDRGSWTSLDWEFKILDVIASGSPETATKEFLMAEIGGTIYGSCSAKLLDTPQNRLKAWIEAAFDMQLSVGFELDTDMLVGRKCKAVTGQYDKRFTDPVTGAPLKGHKVVDLLPLGKSAGADPWAASAAPSNDPWGAPPPF